MDKSFASQVIQTSNGVGYKGENPTQANCFYYHHKRGSLQWWWDARMGKLCSSPARVPDFVNTPRRLWKHVPCTAWKLQNIEAAERKNPQVSISHLILLQNTFCNSTSFQHTFSNFWKPTPNSGFSLYLFILASQKNNEKPSTVL